MSRYLQIKCFYRLDYKVLGKFEVETITISSLIFLDASCLNKIPRTILDTLISLNYDADDVTT